jgi:ABC-2 type transport system permease protein
MGVGAYALVSNEKWEFLPILFWVAFLLWQVVPVMLASFQEQFDLGILLRFPVSFRSYYLLYLVFGLADISTFIGALCCLGIWIGVTVARPDLSLWTALALGGFAAFNVLLVRAVFVWIDRWLSERRTREIAGVVFMVLILSLQLLNPALHQKRHPYPSRSMTPEQAREMVQESAQQKAAFRARYGPWLRSAYAVQGWLPPGLAARAVQQSGQAQPAPALGTLGLLSLWALGAAGVLGRRLRAEYRGENLGSAPRREARPVKAVASRATQIENSGVPEFRHPLFALMEKEARALMRTLPLLWSLSVPVLMVLVLASIFRNSGSGMVSFAFALPLYVAYALLGFTQFFYNSLGAEGAGIQLLFLSPTPIRRVFLAKNLLHSMLFGLDAVLAGLLASLRLGWPSGAMAAATGAWVLFALPCSLIAGNIFSVRMPYRINPGRIARQRGSQANTLSSVLVQAGIMIVGAAVFLICWRLGDLWLAVPAFLALAVFAVFFWLRGLARLDLLANQHRESLLAALMKTE